MPAVVYNPAKHSIFEAKHHVCTACVGENGISDFETYATGYFEAAQLLLVQLLDRKLGLTEDTLVYPILFTLRHGVELSIKHVSRVLAEAELPAPNTDQNTHELKSLWVDLVAQARADRRLVAAMAKLKPAVLQLHEADPLAQEFRYAERTDGAPSLQNHSVVDMVTVLKLAKFTADRFDALFGLAAQVRRERKHGSFTAEFNRPELERLSKQLPPASEWKNSERFAAVKSAWAKRYQLSSRAFGRAVDFIKSHREFAGNIGLAKPFVALSDDTLDRLLSASIKLLAEQAKERLEDWPGEPPFEDPLHTLFAVTRIKLSVSFVSEVNALFYLGRDARMSEEYDCMLEYHSRYTEPASSEALWANFVHVFEKMNFAEDLCRGLRMTGHPEIARKFEPKIKRLNARWRNHPNLPTRRATPTASASRRSRRASCR